jgi:hypothetical protein
MFFTLGSGTYSALWRHSCNFNAIVSSMPSCGHCYSSNKDAISIGSSSNAIIPSETVCGECINWDASKDSTLGYFEAPQNYPCLDNLIGRKYLKQKVIAFEGVSHAWNRTHMELLYGAW